MPATRTSKSKRRVVCSPGALRHQIKGAEGTKWTNLGSWTSGRVDVIDFGRKGGKQKKAGHGTSCREAATTCRRSGHAHIRYPHEATANSGYNHNYNSCFTDNRRYNIAPCCPPQHQIKHQHQDSHQKDLVGDLSALPADVDMDELTWALRESKIYSTGPPHRSSSSTLSPSGSSYSFIPPSEVSIKSLRLSSSPIIASPSTSWSHIAASNRARRGSSSAASIRPSSSASRPPSVYRGRRRRDARPSRASEDEQPDLKHWQELETRFKADEVQSLQNDCRHHSRDSGARYNDDDDGIADDFPPSYSQLSFRDDTVAQATVGKSLPSPPSTSSSTSSLYSSCHSGGRRGKSRSGSWLGFQIKHQHEHAPPHKFSLASSSSVSRRPGCKRGSREHDVMKYLVK